MPLAFKHKTKLGWRVCFSIAPAPRGGGSEILAAARAAVKNDQKRWSGPGVLGRELEGLCSAWAPQHKGVGHPSLKLFLLQLYCIIS